MRGRLPRQIGDAADDLGEARDGSGTTLVRTGGHAERAAIVEVDRLHTVVAIVDLPFDRQGAEPIAGAAAENVAIMMLGTEIERGAGALAVDVFQDVVAALEAQVPTIRRRIGVLCPAAPHGSEAQDQRENGDMPKLHFTPPGPG
jgi:hypothetical protein